eukprot:scaffold10898_cov128-Isochrysis_galbana.AAC.2
MATPESQPPVHNAPDLGVFSLCSVPASACSVVYTCAGVPVSVEPPPPVFWAAACLILGLVGAGQGRKRDRTLAYVACGFWGRRGRPSACGRHAPRKA